MTRTVEWLGVWVRSLCDQYLASREFRARMDSLACFGALFLIGFASGFPHALHIAYVFPVCLAARGAGRKWSYGVVVAAAFVLTLGARDGAIVGTLGWGSFLLNAVLLTGVLRLVGRLETGLTTYQDLATRDSLTELPNRIALDRFGTRAVRRAARAGHALSVVMIDCDDFKRINDTFGHAYGDLVLQVVALCLTRTLRGTGFVARTGGDEFVAVLPGIDRREAEMLLFRAAEQFRNSSVGSSARTGLSIGVAEFRAGDTLDSLLTEADRRMYERKRAGTRRLV